MNKADREFLDNMLSTLKYRRLNNLQPHGEAVLVTYTIPDLLALEGVITRLLDDSVPLSKEDVYQNTIDRLEPDIHMIDPGGFYASASISLKRIADALEKKDGGEDVIMEGQVMSVFSDMKNLCHGQSYPPNTRSVIRHYANQLAQILGIAVIP